MATPWEKLHDRICERAEAYGIQVKERPLGSDEPGEFDGRSITLNPAFRGEEHCYYFVHALGSIVRWSLDPAGCQAVFAELQAAKQHKKEDPERLERAITAYYAYEEDTCEYAAWLLADLGFSEIVPSYTNFARADLESMVQFHRSGEAPEWREFFAHWNQDVASGKRTVEPLEATAVPPFHPTLMRRQEVMQEKESA